MTRHRISRGRAVLLSGVVVVLGGLVSSSAAAAAPAISITATSTAKTSGGVVRGRTIIDYGKRARISGVVAGRQAGFGVVLELRVWPFGTAFASAGQAITRAGGRYSFTVSPAVATEYQVMAADGSVEPSLEVTVYTQPHARLVSLKSCGSVTTCRFSAKLIYTYPPAAAADAADRWFVYTGVRRGSKHEPTRLRRVSSHVGRVKIVPAGPLGVFDVTLSARLKLPHGPSRFRVDACQRTSYAVNGVGLPFHYRCGDRSVHYGPSPVSLG